jgi:hypothetical protein
VASVPFPSVLYDATGLAITVGTADAAAQLPATFAQVPTVAATLAVFPPALLAQVVSMPLSPTLPVALKNAILANVPKKQRSHDEREN